MNKLQTQLQDLGFTVFTPNSNFVVYENNGSGYGERVLICEDLATGAISVTLYPVDEGKAFVSTFSSYNDVIVTLVTTLSQ